MPIQVGTVGPLKRRYLGAQEISKVYRGTNLIYQKPTGELMWPIDATTAPYVVMFVGSSTTQGQIGANRQHDNYVNQLAARIVTHNNAAYSTGRVIPVTSGAQTRQTTPGLWFWNCGLGGTTSADYIGADRRSLMSDLQPNLMIHMIGANDYRNQSSDAAFKTNVQNVINDARTRVPGVRHLFIHSYPALDVTGSPTYRWEHYFARLQEIAAANNDVRVVDVSPQFAERDVVLNGSDPENLIGPDNIHATSAGYKFLANVIADALGLDKRHGVPVYTFKPHDLGGTMADGGEITAVPSTLPSRVNDLVRAAAGVGQNAGQRPTIINSDALANGRAVALFDGTDDTLDLDFGKSIGLPVTVFSVVDFNDAPTNQTLFSRISLSHNGYVWGFRGSLNTYTVVEGAPTGSTQAFINPSGRAYKILATVFRANGESDLYMNQKFVASTGAATNGDVDNTNGPFLSSVRLGANTGRSNFLGAYVALHQVVAGELTQAEIEAKIDSLMAEFGVALELPRAYLEDFGTQEYANTFQTGANRDLTADGWIDRAGSTGTYQISDYLTASTTTQRRLIPSGIGSGYRGFNCYYHNTLRGTSAHWARVKISRIPNTNTTLDPNQIAGVGVVLRHAATGASGTGGGIYCKVTRSNTWRIYTGNSNSTSATAESPIASGTLPQPLVEGDEITACVTSGNRIFMYLNNKMLTPAAGVSSTYNSTQRNTGALISQNDAGELYDFKTGVMGSATPPVGAAA